MGGDIITARYWGGRKGFGLEGGRGIKGGSVSGEVRKREGEAERKEM